MREVFQQEKGLWSRKNNIISFVSIGLVTAFFVYIALTDRNMIWQDVYSQFATFTLNFGQEFSPIFQTSPVYASDTGVLILLGINWFGFYNLLSKSTKYHIDLVIISIFLTLALTGVVTIILGLVHFLYTWSIVPVLLSFGVLVNAASLKELKHNLKSMKAVMRISIFAQKKKSILIIPLALTFGFSFFYAIFLPVTDFDALIYHAEMGKIFFEEHSIPILKGPSIGIEISGNYPPLFSAVSAGLYTLIGRFDDTLLRILPAIFGFCIVLGIYRISERVFPTSGRYSVLLLLSTPLFIHNLIISSPTSLIAASIVLSIYGVLNLRDVFSDEHPRPLVPVILIGTFMGIALLSSYQSLYYIMIPVMTFLILFVLRGNSDKHRMMTYFGIIVAIAILLGTIWYSRNYIYNGNPFYPWLFSPQGDEAMIFKETTKEIQTVGSIVTFGKFDYDVLDIRTLFRFHPVLFPAFSALSVVGLVMLLYKSPHKFSWLAVWATLPILLIFSLGTIFPRYLLPLLPPLIISFGFVIAYATHNISFHKRTFKAAIFASLFMLYVFIGLPVAVSNPAVNVGNYPDKMFFIKHAGDKDQALQVFYDGDVAAWKWLRQNVDSENRIATFDPRLYYISDDYKNVFALDGHDAVPLYSIEKPEQIRAYLVEHKVKYIFDASSPNSHLFYMMPLTRYLGSNDFPEVFAPGFAHIYKVNNDNEIS